MGAWGCGVSGVVGSRWNVDFKKKVIGQGPLRALAWGKVKITQLSLGHRVNLSVATAAGENPGLADIRRSTPERDL